MKNRWPMLIASAVLFAGTAGAQRDFAITSIASEPGSVLISWSVQSATPTGDLLVLPQFQVLRSTDLQIWTPVGALFSGALHQTLSLADTNGTAASYKVQSIISQEYAQLDNVTLSSGQLAGADFFGAELFGATLNQASLNGANFGAADLRNASLTGADLIGAGRHF
jgi:hypothetical protein